MTISLPVAPVPKPRMTQRDRWQNRPPVVRYHRFCDELRALAVPPLPENVWFTFYVPMPASWSAKKRTAMSGKPHQQRPDTDNYIKAIQDALCEDDSYIYDVRGTKYWSSEPHIDIRAMNEVKT